MTKPGYIPSGASAQAPEPEPLPPHLRRRQVIHIVVFDLCMLAELAFAIYMADKWRDTHDFTVVFCVVFLGLLIPTLLASRLLMRRLLPPRPETGALH